MDGLLNCALCGVEITCEEEARLNEARMPFDDVCHRCQCEDRCPVCDGGSFYTRTDVDMWKRVGTCYACDSTARYDVYLRNNPFTTFYPRVGSDTRDIIRSNVDGLLKDKERKRMAEKKKVIEVDLSGMESKQVSVFLSPLLQARLEALVDATGMSKSQLFIEGLNDLCDKLGVAVVIKPRSENEGAE